MLKPGLQIEGVLEIAQALPEVVGAPLFGRVYQASELSTGREQWVVAISSEFTPTETKRDELVAVAKQSNRLAGAGVLAGGAVLHYEGHTIVGHVPHGGALGFTLSGLWGQSEPVIPLAVELAHALKRIHESGTVHGAMSLGCVCVADGHAWTWQQGLAGAFESGALASKARSLRSRQPFPPEFLAFGGRPTTGTDVYAWAMTVTQMISGRPDDSAANEIAAGLGDLDSDHPLVRVLKSCLNENASVRPRDAQEVVFRLAAEGFLAPDPSALASASTSMGSDPQVDAKSPERSSKRTIFSPGALPVPEGGPRQELGGALPPPPSHGRLAAYGLPPPPSPPTGSQPAPELMGGVPAAPPGSPSSSRAPMDSPTLGPGFEGQGSQLQAAPGLDPTMVPGMGEPGQGYSQGPPQGQGGNFGQPQYGYPGAAHVPQAPPQEAQPADSLLGEFAASLDRAITFDEGGSDPGSSEYEPGRVELKPGESATGELMLDNAIAGLEAGSHERAPRLDAEQDIDSHALPDPGMARVSAMAPRVILPRKPGPHGWESRRLTLLSVFLPLIIIIAAFVHLGPEAGGYDVFIGLAPRAGDGDGEVEEDTDGDAFVEREYSIPDFGKRPEDLPMVLKKCEYGTVVLGGDICIDQGEFPGLGQIPMTRIGYAEAQQACEMKGSRLCRPDEFQAACAGKDGFRFPYGDFFKDKCNTSDTNGRIVRVRASGASGGCRSSISTYDQVGNVGEWVEGGYVMGGDLRTPGQGAMCKSRGKPPRGFKGEFVGFRCCMDRTP